jgi:Na+/H+-dicarboxylate symporter
MFLVFIGTEFIAALVTIIAAWIFPVHLQIQSATAFTIPANQIAAGDQITSLLTVDNFFELLSRKNMLALIIFSVLTGFATAKAGEKGAGFRNFLNAANEVFKNVLFYIMKLAPVGLGAYFAYQIGTVGPELFGTYARALVLFHGVSIFYYVVFFSLYAFVAGGFSSIKKYWKNNIYPSATAIATCSSIATIPVNLQAAIKMNVPAEVSNLVIPLGAPLHKDGSAISSIIKIVVVFAMLNKPLFAIEPIVLALGISIIVSVVEGGIPNGGYVGELLMIAAYNLPREVIPTVMILGTLVDPIATLLNVTGDTVAAMMVARVCKRDFSNP